MHDLFRGEAIEAKGNAFLDTTVLRPPFFSAWALKRLVGRVSPVRVVHRAHDRSNSDMVGARTTMLDQLRLRCEGLRDELARQLTLVEQESARVDRRLADLRVETKGNAARDRDVASGKLHRAKRRRECWPILRAVGDRLPLTRAP